MTAACEPACPFHDDQGGTESTLAPSGPSGLKQADYDVDLRRRHAGCSACDGDGWVNQIEPEREPVLCRREPPF